MGKGEAHKAKKFGLVGSLCPWRQPHDGTPDLRHWRKRARRHVKKPFSLECILCHHAEITARLCSWSGDDTFDHLALEHQYQRGDILPPAGEPLEYRRRDIVGQVGGDLDFIITEIGEGEVQGVSVNQMKVLRGGKLALQFRDEVAVKFDGYYVCSAFDQVFGKGAGAGADLYDGVGRAEIEGVDDAAGDGGVTKEVLAEAFLCFHRQKLTAGIAGDLDIISVTKNFYVIEMQCIGK